MRPEVGSGPGVGELRPRPDATRISYLAAAAAAAAKARTPPAPLASSASAPPPPRPAPSPPPRSLPADSAACISGISRPPRPSCPAGPAPPARLVPPLAHTVPGAWAGLPAPVSRAACPNTALLVATPRLGSRHQEVTGQLGARRGVWVWLPSRKQQDLRAREDPARLTGGFC